MRPEAQGPGQVIRANGLVGNHTVQDLLPPNWLAAQSPKRGRPRFSSLETSDGAPMPCLTYASTAQNPPFSVPLSLRVVPPPHSDLVSHLFYGPVLVMFRCVCV